MVTATSSGEGLSLTPKQLWLELTSYNLIIPTAILRTFTHNSLHIYILPIATIKLSSFNIGTQIGLKFTHDLLSRSSKTDTDP